MGFLIDEKRQLFGLETNKTTYALQLIIWDYYVTYIGDQK